jgi:hypothetical protein
VTVLPTLPPVGLIMLIVGQLPVTTLVNT